MVRDFLLFRRMITPVIIQVLFWIAVFGAVVVGVVGFFVGLIQTDVEVLAASLALIVFGPLVIRIYAELLILVFRINETLTDILVALRSRSREPS